MSSPANALARTVRVARLDDLLRQVRGEYDEMPGLSLTLHRPNACGRSTGQPARWCCGRWLSVGSFRPPLAAGTSVRITPFANGGKHTDR